MTDEIVPYESIEKRIFLIRGQKVMLDFDLAGLYGVENKQLNRQVKRNSDRFPSDFMFQLTLDEYLRCQNDTTILAEGQANMQLQNATTKFTMRRNLPYVFTEHGILMLSSVLKSKRAIDVNIQIMRTFSKLRQMVSNNKELSNKIDLLEKRVFKHDSDIRELVRDIRKLTIEKTGSKGKIGFLR